MPKDRLLSYRAVMSVAGVAAANELFEVNMPKNIDLTTSGDFMCVDFVVRDREAQEAKDAN